MIAGVGVAWWAGGAAQGLEARSLRLVRALVVERRHVSSGFLRMVPSGAKAILSFVAFAARLKSCPDTKVSSQVSRNKMFTKSYPFFVLILCYESSQIPECAFVELKLRHRWPSFPDLDFLFNE